MKNYSVAENVEPAMEKKVNFIIKAPVDLKMFKEMF